MTDIVTRLIQLIIMALFGNKKSEEEIMEDVLSKNDVYGEINCEVFFPDLQLKIATRSGFAKGAATLAFGLVGLAATSGIKQEEEQRTMTTAFQIVDNGIVFKKATKDLKDLRIPYDNIVKVKPDNGMFRFTLLLLENQEIHVRMFSIKGDSLESPKYFRDHLINIINERACGAQYEEAGWGLEHAEAEPQEVKEEGESLMDELERLGNMYEKGLLTDDEFALAKKKLLGQ